MPGDTYREFLEFFSGNFFLLYTCNFLAGTKGTRGQTALERYLF